jgi:hypothetical protein
MPRDRPAENQGKDDAGDDADEFEDGDPDQPTDDNTGDDEGVNTNEVTGDKAAGTDEADAKTGPAKKPKAGSKKPEVKKKGW